MAWCLQDYQAVFDTVCGVLKEANDAGAGHAAAAAAAADAVANRLLCLCAGCACMRGCRHLHVCDHFPGLPSFEL
jgi:hypothetical protein